MSSKKVSGSSPTTTTAMMKKREKCFSEKNGAEQQGSKRLIPKTTMTMMKNIPHEDGGKTLLGEKWSEAAGAEPLIVWPPIRS